MQLDISYASPPPATQKPGIAPLGLTVFRTNITQKLDAGFGQLASLVFVDDKLYASCGTALVNPAKVDQTVAGVAWAVIDLEHPLKSKADGILAAPRSNNLLYPAFAVHPGGKGVLAVSVSGPDCYPSVGYPVFDGHGFGRQAGIHIVAAGAGPTDEQVGIKVPQIPLDSLQLQQ